ncbi:hypothetical protein DUNSADRAFT_3820 [Dunaliella salina]|uniref:Encoded protein n=1 Tax=Dunaliella salina TaxID=3046 RepID=A0ABQ7GT68_DUNSA|nr:hypothetical protein DUNSADRAFT_3820 [Dunaliella salina]|eukprot:KAF5837804.1 hypothetical protein DUNSADRAFT_3820 [Dunaliella salina]
MVSNTHSHVSFLTQPHRCAVGRTFCSNITLKSKTSSMLKAPKKLNNNSTDVSAPKIHNACLRQGVHRQSFSQQGFQNSKASPSTSPAPSCKASKHG